MRAGPLMLAVLLLLAGCGGGGGGSSGPVTYSVAIGPNPISASYYLSDLPNTISFYFSFNGGAAPNNIRVLETDSSGIFSPMGAAEPVLTVTPNNAISYTGTLRVPNLPAGTYTGNLLIQICGDNACQTEYKSAALPYSITVMQPSLQGLSPNPLIGSTLQGEGISFNVQLNGYGFENPAFAMIQDSAGLFTTSQPVALHCVNTCSGGLLIPAGLSDTTHSGTLTVKVCGDSACNLSYGTATLPYTIQVMSLVAGQAGVSGNADGSGTAAQFSDPANLAVDAAGNLYVADFGNSRIRKITSDGTVSTLPANQSVSPAPQGIAVDSKGNIYFGNQNSAIARMTPAGVVSMFAAGAATSLTTDNADNLYAVDHGGHTITEFATNGTSSVITPQAGFDYPVGVTIDANGNIYFTAGPYMPNNPTGSFSDVFRLPQPGTVTALSAGITQPQAITADPSGYLLVTDYSNSAVYKFAPGTPASVCIAKGVGLSNGVYLIPTAIAVTKAGRVYLSDSASNVIVSTVLP